VQFRRVKLNCNSSNYYNGSTRDALNKISIFFLGEKYVRYEVCFMKRKIVQNNYTYKY
jgi:hypothetical protein